MRKGKTVIGKDVLSLADGTRIHSVKDLIIGEDNDTVVALLVDEGGLLSGSTVVPIEAVHSFGKDAVVIADASSVVAASAYPRVHAIIDRKESLLGKKVFTDEGEQLGTIGDMYFDEKDGRILGLEVSNGAFGDLAKGTSYLAMEDVQRSGSEVVFVNPVVSEQLDAQLGGLQGALSSAREKAGQLSSDARDMAGQATDDARSSFAGLDPEQSLVGRKSGTDVMDENGSVVVASGQRITAAHVERAKETGNLQMLTKAAMTGQASEVGDQTGAALSQLGDSAGSMWDRFTGKLSELTDATGQRMDQQQTKAHLDRIADAIGRPVTKVILDREDSVILNLGEIITHQSIQRAHDNGMLDSLLGNVYKAEVTFTQDQLRVAQVEGDSTVEKATGGAALVDELEQKVQSAQDEKRAEQEQKKQGAEEGRRQREQERDQRAREREQSSMDREQEIQAARTDSAGPDGSGDATADAEPQLVTTGSGPVRTA